MELQGMLFNVIENMTWRQKEMSMRLSFCLRHILRVDYGCADVTVGICWTPSSSQHLEREAEV